MILLPAIDLLGGACVRLRQGDYGTAGRVAEDAVETALSFAREGAGWLHLVDLDGAKAGAPKNRALILELIRQSGLQVEVGGGIRAPGDVEDYLSHGAARIILGSAAAEDPGFVEEMARRYPGQIAAGIDAKEGRVMTGGWLRDTGVPAVELAKRLENAGISVMIYTDIATDGMLSGPNLAELGRMRQAVSCQVIASGGVSSLEDIRALRDLKLDGAICGKALYAGAFRLSDALQAAAPRAAINLPAGGKNHAV